MKTAYISGSITNNPDAKQEFEEAEKKYPHAINPMKNFNGQGDLDWHKYMGLSLWQLLDCNEIIMLDGWIGSEGAMIEWLFAKGLGIKISFDGYEPKSHHYIHAKSIFNEAYNTVQRNMDSYGNPYDDYKRVAEMFEPENQVTKADIIKRLMQMVLVKVSRQDNRFKEDNLVDIAGYALCIKMVRGE